MVDRKCFFVAALVLLSFGAPVVAEPDFSGFDAWLEQTARAAVDEGISSETVRQAFDGLKPDPRVIGFDRRQPEFVQTFEEYLTARVTPYRIGKARQFVGTEAKLLARITEAYDVEGQFVIAFWGLESSFGQYQGKYDVVRSLATLGYDPRRSTFFTKELMNALRIVDEGHVTLENLKGGWAGAMGQNQFLPSSFLNYAADFDGDGRKNIWSSRPDVYASIANYLSRNGWRPGADWGARVALPESLDVAALKPEKVVPGCRALRHHTRKMKLADWRALGVSPDKQLSEEAEWAIVVPDAGVKVSYLVGGNFRTILSYNCANKYAVSVGLLADLIAAQQTAAATGR